MLPANSRPRREWEPSRLGRKPLQAHVAELFLAQVSIGAIRLDQFVVRALLHQPPLIQHDHLVAIDNRRKAVGENSVSELRAKFIGHWKLVSWEDLDAEGNRATRNMTGRILYDEAGNMSAHLFPTGGHEGSVTPGYLAYFGKYRIHPDFHTVIHSVEGSNIVRWIGTDLVRYYEFSDGKLILTLRRNGQVHSALTWKRLR